MDQQLRFSNNTKHDTEYTNVVLKARSDPKEWKITIHSYLGHNVL